VARLTWRVSLVLVRRGATVWQFSHDLPSISNNAQPLHIMKIKP
jgi:hypothetical protein